MEQNATEYLIAETKALLAAEGLAVAPEAEELALKAPAGTLRASASVKKLKTADKTAALLFFRLIEINRSSRVREFNTAHLCDIHKKLYSGILNNAGILRKTDVVKDNACCISFKLLRASLKAALRQLNRARLKLMTRAETASSLCHFCRELLILSPFTEGSELVMRIILKQFCAACGLVLDYSKCAPGAVAAAEKTCLASDDVRPLYDCFIGAISHRHAKPRAGKPVQTLSVSALPTGKKAKEKPDKAKSKKKAKTGGKNAACKK